MKEGWQIKKLGEVCEVISGSTPKTNIDKYWGGEHFWITPAEIKTDKWINKTERTLTDEGIKSAHLQILPKGTVLLSSRAPIGKLAITQVPMYCNQGFKNLVCSDKVYNVYLYWFLLHNIDYIKALGTGATFKEISKKVVQNIDILLPPLSEQAEIVSELDLLNEIIEKKRLQLKELDNLSQAIFYDMFGDPVANEKRWDVKRLKDVCTKITDGTHNSPKSFDNGDYMYITAKNIKKDGFDFSNISYLSSEQHSIIYSRCNPVMGDILYIKDGATTGIAMINTLKEEFSLLSSVALLKTNNSLINNRYLRDTLNTSSMYINIRKNMGGAAITRLTLKKIEVIQIPVPPLSLQQEFAEKITAIEEQKKRIQASLAETETLLNSRMDFYFN